MSLTIIHEATLAAVRAAPAYQDDKLAALAAPFVTAGEVTVKHMLGASNRGTAVYDAWEFDTNTPRGMTLGALTSYTAVADVEPTLLVFLADSTEIFTFDCAEGSGSVPFLTWISGARPNLSDASGKMRITADPSLPLSSGIPPAGVAATCAFIGDSLMAQDFGVSPMYWHLGRQAKSLQPVANSGFPGRSTLGLSTCIGNSYLIATEPGLDGLSALYGTLGWIFVRIGANDYRGGDGSAGGAITPTFQGYIDSITTDLLAIAEHVVWMASSPLSDASFTRKTNIASWNTYLQSVAAANPTRVHFIDDCADLVDGSGDIVASYFQADRVHFSSAGTYQMGVTAEVAFTTLFSNQTYANPLVTSAAHVYPTFDQWNPRPTNTGTGGTFGSGWSGTCPTDMLIEGNGAGTGGTVAIVAADIGDANQTPWVVITPTALQTGSAISISFPGSGRTITTSDPVTLEQMVEVKFTGLTGLNGMDAWIQASAGVKLTKVQHLVWDAGTTLTETVILRQKLYRVNSGATGSTTCYIYLGGPTGTPTGTLAFRNFSAEG